MSKDEALLAARLLQVAEIELLPMRSLFEDATRISIEMDHPAYDCVYLALAAESECRFVTADERFLRKLRQSRDRTIRSLAVIVDRGGKILNALPHCRGDVAAVDRGDVGGRLQRQRLVQERLRDVLGGDFAASRLPLM